MKDHVRAGWTGAVLVWAAATLSIRAGATGLRPPPYSAGEPTAAEEAISVGDTRPGVPAAMTGAPTPAVDAISVG